MLAPDAWLRGGDGCGRRALRRCSSSATTAVDLTPCGAQTTTDGPEPDSVDTGGAGDGVVAQLLEQRRVGEPERLVEDVVEGLRRAARRRRRRSPRRAMRPAPTPRRQPRRGGANSGSRERAWLGVHARIRDDDDRGERQIDRDPSRVRSRRRCARSGRRRRGAQRRDCRRGLRAAGPSSSSSSAESARPRTAAARDEPGRDRRRARAEPALERDPVHEAEAVTLDRSDERERAQRKMRRVAGQLLGAFALDGDERLTVRCVSHLQLVPEIERRGGAVEPGAEVGRGGRRADDERSRGHPRENRLERSARRESAVRSVSRRPPCPSGRGR